ncbi:MAG: UvrD-helicase domain-containing protein [Verrucomicrobiota bacterium]
MKFTEAQQRAIRARGNVLVAAGAGTGKTRTLVERCLDCLLREKPEVSLDEMLMVTFTEAAAAEIRQRIRARLEQERDASPAGLRWHEQLALLDTAPIGTLHGFCLQLVRQHFYELGLDPQLAVLPGEEARLLETETLDSVLRGAYAGTDEDSAAIRELIRVQGRGWDRSIREWVHKIHDYSQTLPDPQGWIARQQAMFDEAEPRVWAGWLDEFLPGWIERARNAAGAIAANNEFARDWAGRLGAATAGDRAGWNDLLSGLLDACGGRRKALTEPLKKWIEQADFLHSLAPGGGTGALAQDWDWARLPMRALLRLTVKFQETFQESKRELGVLDFHDLEQYALRLLWDSRGPTEIARQWRRRLRFIFVDEYQDINLAQDTLLKALSRDGAEANRFLVGDVKQSIYRFRLARPEIFQGYSRQWRGAGGITVPLTENFRGREPLLEFANSLFAMVMQDPLAPCGYDEEARLRFGAAADRAPLRGKAGEALVEIHIRLKQAAGAEPAAGEDAAGELDDAGKEARLVACRLRELHRAGHPVWDDNLRAFRKVEWKDMAVLLRSPAGKAEAFAREFSKCGIPLSVARRGFYDSLEISDLVSLLQLLDNPLQDLPLLAVLRSPLAGASPDQLAEIRLASHRTHFWTALQRWRAGLASAEAGGRIAKFLDRFARWRRLSRQWSLSRCLDAVLAETDYEAWLLTQPRGAQRRANVLRLLELARQFDRFQRQGLFRFLEFVDAQRAAETEPESAGAVTDDSVQLLSIHQSKGLEFPVVALADLGKKFNETDLRADVLLDEEFGLCPQIHPPGGGGRYPSLPAWLAAQRQRRELLAEELRLLYVAVTRPRDALLLFGSISEKQFQSRWTGPDEFMPDKLLDVRSYADWIAPWFARHAAPGAEGRLSGQNDLVRWVIHEQAPALPQGK